MKIRFLEPGNRPYKPTPLNYFVYDRYIRTPSVGLNTLATIVKELVDDTYMYSESISRIDMADVEDAEVGLTRVRARIALVTNTFCLACCRMSRIFSMLQSPSRGSS